MLLSELLSKIEQAITAKYKSFVLDEKKERAEIEFDHDLEVSGMFPLRWYKFSIDFMINDKENTDAIKNVIIEKK